jgi:hypothetical protein
MENRCGVGVTVGRGVDVCVGEDVDVNVGVAVDVGAGVRVTVECKVAVGETVIDTASGGVSFCVDEQLNKKIMVIRNKAIREV